MPSFAQYLDRQVPRYTSYPTAPHFSGAVDGPTYGRWLAELDPDLPLSLYFHIPFCNTLCWFCGCHTTIVNAYAPVTAYLDRLLAEVDRVADALPGRFAVKHIHWGGGSPTILTDEDWSRTMAALHARFTIAPDAEIAVELDPRDTTEAYVRALAAAGVNRCSLGVQDFDPVVQKAVNRVQPYEVTERVVGWLRDHGISALNIDLMYGLPFQTEEGVAAMADQALTLSPDRVALFGYAHVPWMKDHQKLLPEDRLPAAEARWAQSEAARARLLSSGMLPIGFDHFARPGDSLATGRRHRNFQGYTADAAPVLLGFGASAIGSLPQGYVQNIPGIDEYSAAVDNGNLATYRGIALTDEDRIRRTVIERLMCDLSVDLEKAAPGRNFTAELAELAPLIVDGLVVVEGNRISVTERGRALVRVVAATFDGYLHKGRARHSRAV